MIQPLSYKAAGVDIDAGDALVERIKVAARRTPQSGVLAGIGGFGALFAMPPGLHEPVLVSGTDGVGTKLRLAFALDRHDTIGIDLVAMSVNDILVQGAQPLFFLDYFACGRLDVARAAQVVGGIAEGCVQAGCTLIGGETAEMPDSYPDGEYDLAGFAVGVVERSRILDGQAVRAGDVLLGLASSGAHSNGYSLIRRIAERALGAVNAATLAEPLAGRPLADWLMAPTRIYVSSVLKLLAAVDGAAVDGKAVAAAERAIHGLAHITGGGLLENVPRILPAGLAARIERSAWPVSPLFDWLQRQGAVDAHEMHRVFNCGIGMVLVVEASRAAQCRMLLEQAGETVYALGTVVTRPTPDAPQAVVV